MHQERYFYLPGIAGILSWLNLCLIQQLNYQKHWMKTIHQFPLLKLKMKLLNQSDSSFVPQPLTEATLECEPLSWRYPQYTQASTWLLEVACWKYLEKVFWMEYLNKYIYWQKVFKIPRFHILNLHYFKYQIQKVFQIRMWNTSTSNTAHVCIPVSIENCSSPATSHMCSCTDVYMRNLSSCICTESR